MLEQVQETTSMGQGKEVLIRDLLENPRHYCYIGDNSIDYMADLKRKCMISKADNGISEQIVKGKTLTWKATFIADELYLISTPTRDKVPLYGDAGLENGEHILNRVARLYRNDKLGFEAKPLTEDMFWRLTPEKRKGIGEVWLATQFVEKGIYVAYKGFRFTKNGRVCNAVLKVGDDDVLAAFPICVVIKLNEGAKITVPDMKIVL